MNIKREIENEISKMSAIEKKADERIKRLPPGNLRCAKNKNSFQYYIDGKYASKRDIDYISEIAEREYLEGVIGRIRKRILKLKNVIKSLEEQDYVDYFYKLHPARRALLQPLIESKESFINRWQAEEYEYYGFDEFDETEYYTQRGERVRSKSEMIIANELFRYEIPYKYEPPLPLYDRFGEKIFRPDFIALNKSTLKEIVIEHWGMLDDPKYITHNVYKWDLYERNDFLLGENLMVFHETSDRPLSVLTVDKYIEEFLL